MRKVDFHILAGVAEAAEKYQVYAATTVCNMHMWSVPFHFSAGVMTDALFSSAAVPKHPFEVLVYAYKHNYNDIVDEATPLAIDKPKMFLEFASATAPCIILTWVSEFRTLCILWGHVFGCTFFCRQAEIPAVLDGRP
jgi:hypothetical protein